MKLLNQQIIKNNNLKKIYNLIYQEPGISRARLAKLSGLSKPTVSTLTDELIKKGFIHDTGITADTSSVGRKPNGLHLLSNRHFVAVISWSKDGVFARLIDVCGGSAKEVSSKLSGSDTYVSVSRQLFDRMREGMEAEQLLGVCVIVPAMIDTDCREIYAVTLDQAHIGEHPLLKSLQDIFSDVPAAIFNDTACAGYAEKVFAGISQSDFAYINFQHGIGAALFIQNRLLGNATASYTQFGHYSVDPDGIQCSCGNRGCLELVISEDALKKRISETGKKSLLEEYEEITYADLSSAALCGDTAAQQVICDMAKDFSLAISNLACIVRPRLVVIGGKGKELGPLFLEEIIRNLKHSGFRHMLDSMQIRYSFLDSTAYFAGGMKFFFDIYYDFTQDLTGQFFVG